MLTLEQLNQFKELLPQFNSTIVIVGPDASVDHLAAATALTQALVASGKEVVLASPTSIAEDKQFLSGLEGVKDQLGNQNLAISFAYEETAIDKVSYHIDEDDQRFYLVIKPQAGARPLDTQTVEFSYTGASADLVVLVGVHSLESLDQLFIGYEDLYQQATVVTFHSFEPEIGNIRFNVGELSSLSEGMGRFIYNLELPMTPEAGTNLLVAIEDSTDGLKSLAVTADTFELIARLMRDGARRLRRVKPVIASNQTQVQAHDQNQVTNTRPSKEVTSQSFAEILSQKKAALEAEFADNQQANNQRKNNQKKNRGNQGNNQPGGLHYKPSNFRQGGQS